MCLAFLINEHMNRHTTRIILFFVSSAVVGVWFYSQSAGLHQVSPVSAAEFRVSRDAAAEDAPTVRTLFAEIDQGLTSESGEAHSLALDVIMGWIRDQRELTSEDREKLLAYLAQPQLPGLEDGEWEERVNEILNFLRGQTGEVPGLADQLVGMVGGEETSPVMRMYALQHIALWIPREPSEENRVVMVECLKRVAASPTDSHAGVAVLFLSELESNREIPSDLAPGEFLKRAALRLVSDSSARPDVRISALHACTERETREVLPEARRMATDTTLMIPVRKAAIHCLGRLGGPEDRALLESLGADNRTLAEATKPALRRLAK